MQIRQLLIIVLALSGILLSWYAYDQIPMETIATHWNTLGEADGHMPKLHGLFLLPSLSIVLTIFFFIIPHLDPLKKNIAEFRKYYDGFIIVFLVFMLYIQALVITWNMGWMYNMFTAIMPGLSLLFYYLGIMMEHSKRNWFIGIRTPWTLSSPKVWDKTHKLGSMLFKALAGYFLILVFLETWIQEYMFFVFLIPVLGVAFGLVAYSYWAYSKQD